MTAIATFALINVFFIIIYLIIGRSEGLLSAILFYFFLYFITSPLWVSDIYSLYCDKKKEIIEVAIKDLPKHSYSDKKLYVLTDKGMFTVKSSFWNGTYNNLERYNSLKIGSTYTVEICGCGKGLFSDYKNILTIK